MAWDENEILQMIKNRIEESLNLDYKDAGALEKTDGKKREITKDVSSFANADGGTLIYGISESQQEPHFPGSVNPIRRSEISKEWLEQVISNIRPKIEGVRISPVPLSSDSDLVIYVVEIPASRTAHQATDGKYYKRFNFESVPMVDYEIRLAMKRNTEADLRITKMDCDFDAQETQINSLNARIVRISPRIWVENFSFVPVRSVAISLIGWGLGPSDVSRGVYSSFEVTEPAFNIPGRQVMGVNNQTSIHSGESYVNFMPQVVIFRPMSLPVRIGTDWFPAVAKMGICIAVEEAGPKFFQTSLELNQAFFQMFEGRTSLGRREDLLLYNEVSSQRPVLSHLLT